MRRALCLLLAVAVCAACSQSQTAQPSRAPAGTRHFAFAAAGDHGARDATARSLHALDQMPVRFYLALGDLSYDQTATDRAWCRYVRDHLPTKGSRFPFELEVGNHEQDGGPDGRITNFARCLPDRLHARVGPRGRYGAEYALNVPAVRPLARILMIAPNLTVAGERYTYGPRSRHRAWLVRQIAGARKSGIPWVIVALHYPCLTTGIHGCDSGTGVLNLLLRKRVDLVLTGHNHIYERSRQLRLNAATCPTIRPGAYNAHCVVGRGDNGRYLKGSGTVFITAGTFGGRTQPRVMHDPDRPYFAKVDDSTFGLVRYVVRARRLRGEFVPTTGTFTDSFVIER